MSKSQQFKLSILRHGGIWGAADEAVLNKLLQNFLYKNKINSSLITGNVPTTNVRPTTNNYLRIVAQMKAKLYYDGSWCLWSAVGRSGHTVAAQHPVLTLERRHDVHRSSKQVTRRRSFVKRRTGLQPDRQLFASVHFSSLNSLWTQNFSINIIANIGFLVSTSFRQSIRFVIKNIHLRNLSVLIQFSIQNNWHNPNYSNATYVDWINGQVIRGSI